MGFPDFASGARFPLGPFTAYEGNPILRPGQAEWESHNVYNPTAIVDGDEVVLLYRAHSDDIVSSIGLARSRDGLHFEREPEPVLAPAEDYESHGCEDPRLAVIDGVYYLTYTGWDGRSAQLCLATSTDLHHWDRHGPLFGDFDTFATIDPKPQGWSKAGVIVPQQIDGRWWMYFGEGAIYWATSDDLIHWTPGTTPDKPLHAPIPGTFEADLVEIGPSPVLTDNGLILLATNGARRTKRADGGLDVDYRCGQIVIDPSRPTEILARMNAPWLEPQTFEDTHGLVSYVTFVEGLVRFHGLWFAYYGQADTTLGVAIHDPAHPWGPATRVSTER
jgi:predicted GH43/DUF377 family glycosyl hydrolase